MGVTRNTARRRAAGDRPGDAEHARSAETNLDASGRMVVASAPARPTAASSPAATPSRGASRMRSVDLDSRLPAEPGHSAQGLLALMRGGRIERGTRSLRVSMTRVGEVLDAFFGRGPRRSLATDEGRFHCIRLVDVSADVRGRCAAPHRMHRRRNRLVWSRNRRVRAGPRGVNCSCRVAHGCSSGMWHSRGRRPLLAQSDPDATKDVILARIELTVRRGNFLHASMKEMRMSAPIGTSRSAKAVAKPPGSLSSRIRRSKDLRRSRTAEAIGIVLMRKSCN